MFRIVEDAGPPLPDNLSERLRDFFDQCFNKDPTKRPSAEELFEHPWLKDTWVELKVCNQNIDLIYLLNIFVT